MRYFESDIRNQSTYRIKMRCQANDFMGEEGKQKCFWHNNDNGSDTNFLTVPLHADSSRSLWHFLAVSILTLWIVTIDWLSIDAISSCDCCCINLMIHSIRVCARTMENTIREHRLGRQRLGKLVKLKSRRCLTLCHHWLGSLASGVGFARLTRLDWLDSPDWTVPMID